MSNSTGIAAPVIDPHTRAAEAAVDAAIRENGLGSACPTVKINNVGPIETLALPIPAEGGVVILKGVNGCGKSKALEATQALIRGNGSLAVRDRQLTGSVDGFGAKITVGRSTRRTGELDCLSLEGKLDIAALVDPGMKDAAAADARRIKALVSLTGIKADKTLFVELLGNEEDFEAVVSQSATETDDFVEMAAKIKRDIEAAARRLEDEAAKHQGFAKGLLESIAGVDCEQESDAEVLQRGLEAAVESHLALKNQAEAFQRMTQSRERAKSELERAKSEYRGPSEAEATREYANAEANLIAAVEAEAKAKAAWMETQQHRINAQKELKNADSVLDQAAQHESMIAVWAAQLATKPYIDDVSLDAMADAAQAVTAARERIEVGAKVRQAKGFRADAEDRARLATQANKDALRLREAAKSTDEVLSKAVASDVLRVEAGRLVLDTPERGATFFAELSMGQRWKIAIDIAAERVGVGGIVVVEQEAWESLDPANRQFIAEHAQRRRVVILTAEATDGGLRAEVFQPSQSA